MFSLGVGIVVFLGLSLYAAKKIKDGSSGNILVSVFIGLLLSATWTYYAWHSKDCQSEIACETWEERFRQNAHAKRYPVKYSVFTDSGWPE